MSVAVALHLPQRRYDPTKILAVTLLVSFAVHAAYVLSLSGGWRTLEAQKPIEMVMITVEPPKPPPPPEPEKPPEPPKPPPKVKVAIPKPEVEEPPPPTEEAPKEDDKPPPIVIGIQLQGTSSAGAFAAPVGNSAMGGIAPK